MTYAELHSLSNFSFLTGASHPEELVRRAADLGYQALAITDQCSLAGVVRAHVAARDTALQLIIGSEFTLSDGLRLLLLATDRCSYGTLCALITDARRRAAKGSYRSSRDDFEHMGESACLTILVAHAAGDGLPEQAGWLKERFAGHAWLGVGLFRDGRDRQHLQRCREVGRALGLPLVAAGDVHMHVRARRALQDTLTAIRLGVPLTQAGRRLFPNAERRLRSLPELAQIYPPELLRETLDVAARCRFSLDELRYEYPEEIVPAGRTPAVYLRELSEAGAARRWPGGTPAKVSRQIEHELALIAELGYEQFFLTVYDIVEFARSQNILCQGRGSAANSAVCFCLGITEVDPARMEMLFERFISKERNEPPDIDVDFEHERREEVIQYVYRKYGRQRAALAATVICYRARSAIRNVGKALGLSLEQIDRLAKNVYWWDGRKIVETRLRELGFDPEQAVIRRLMILVETLIGFPRHLSQHVGGFVIARGRLSELVPIENAAMAERTVIQWDKDDLDALGLLKVDCLGLGMLTAIHRAFDLIEDFRGRRLSMATLPADDPATYAMIHRADTVGVFQIESRAQMAMLPRLRPANYYDLVIEVAIIRPGPIQGEMVHPYLRRRQGVEPVSYPSEDVRGVLERTLGVPIFQEQVIKLAMVAAGFTPGEADQLRRSMATWRRNGGLERFESRLVEGMAARGYAEHFARQIFQQILGFGEYGFPESHAASFALLVYVSAWLKCHEPAAFCCAMLNSQPLGFYAPAQLVQNARRNGVDVRPVDVCVSDWDCSLESRRDGEPAVRLGLRRVKGLPQAAADRLIEARRCSPFTDVRDLAGRARLDRGELEALAAAGALAELAGHRHQARWQTRGVERELPAVGNHFSEAPPLLRRPSEGEDIAADYAHLGLSLRRHPLALLRSRLTKLHFVTADRLPELPDGSRIRTGGLVITRQRPGTATGVVFVTLEDETGYINVVVWSTLVERQRRELLASRLMGVAGKLQSEDGVIHVIAERLEDHSHLLGGLQTRSRDFG
jgi:error-prone DNA polymerase